VLNILIVDDEPAVLMVIAHMLETMQMHPAIRAVDGLQKAKDALTGEKFDLVISDLSMSGRNGIEGLELLSHIKSTSVDTEVFLMTGYSTDEVRQEAYKRGALCYFEKPLDINIFLSSVHKVAVSKGLL
jgi:DNA-binding NtrC family response regulator